MFQSLLEKQSGFGAFGGIPPWKRTVFGFFRCPNQHFPPESVVQWLRPPEFHLGMLPRPAPCSWLFHFRSSPGRNTNAFGSDGSPSNPAGQKTRHSSAPFFSIKNRRLFPRCLPRKSAMNADAIQPLCCFSLELKPEETGGNRSKPERGQLSWTSSSLGCFFCSFRGACFMFVSGRAVVDSKAHDCPGLQKGDVEPSQTPCNRPTQGFSL